jgi:glycerol-3-phosphate cytidylyltransferase-like family protein
MPEQHEKILEASQAAEWVRAQVAAGRKVHAVAGLYDPLLAAHAERLDKLAGSGQVLAVVISGGKDLLPAEGRCEMLAALKAVAAVVAGDDALLDELREAGADAGAEVVDARAEDAAIRQAFGERVRQSARRKQPA